MLLFIALLVIFVLVWLNNQTEPPTISPRPLLDFKPAPRIFKATRTLIISGGGIRGLAAVMYLKDAYADDQTDFFANFDVFAGTSTGSIIASVLCARKEVRTRLKNTPLLASVERHFKVGSLSSVSDSRFSLLLLEYLYVVWSVEKLFVRSPGFTLRTLGGLVGPRYPSPIGVIMDIFGKLNMVTFKQGLMLVSQEIQSNQAALFDNMTEQGIERAQLFYLGEVVCMCTATPLLFPAYAGYVDAGSIYNNPVQPVFERLQFYPKLSISVIGLDNKSQVQSLGTSNNGIIQWLPYAFNFFMHNTSFISTDFQTVLDNLNVRLTVEHPMSKIDMYVGLIDFDKIPQFMQELDQAYPKSGWST